MSASFAGREDVTAHWAILFCAVSWGSGTALWLKGQHQSYSSSLPSASQHWGSAFSALKCLMYGAGWRHVAWLFCWSLVLKCGCRKSWLPLRLLPLTWELSDDNLVLTRRLLSIPPCSCLWQGSACHTRRHEMPVCLLSKQPSRKVTSYLASWPGDPSGLQEAPRH